MKSTQQDADSHAVPTKLVFIKATEQTAFAHQTPEAEWIQQKPLQSQGKFGEITVITMPFLIFQLAYSAEREKEYKGIKNMFNKCDVIYT